MCQERQTLVVGERRGRKRRRIFIHVLQKVQERDKDTGSRVEKGITNR